MVRTRIVIAFLMACTLAWGQGTTAQINGTVRDESGLGIPGATVKVTQTATGAVRNSTSGADGAYVLTNLPIGPYQMEISKDGFGSYLQSGIVLQVNSDPIIDAALKVGSVASQVSVEADAALVETRNTGIGQVIDNTRVLELPLNGRQASELILLAGAAVPGGNQGTNRNYPTESISVAGGLNNGLVYMLDGGTHNDPYNNLNLPLPFPDALQEFKVETGAVPAQYGQHSAGAVNIVTKSGTNAYHGDLFYFVRNGALNARNAFALTRDGLKRNQFGGTFGGAILKNKLFFFGGEQATIQRSAPSDSFAYVPTAAMMAGDFTAYASPACNAGRALTLRAPFANSRLALSQFSPAAVNLTKKLPAAIDDCGLTRFGQRTNANEHIMVGRVDYQMSDRHSLFTRYEFARLDNPSNYDGSNLLSFTEPDYKRRGQSLVIGDTLLITSSVVNSFRATYLRTLAVKFLTQDFFTFSEIGVKNLYYPAGYAKVPLMTVAGGFNVAAQPGTPGNTNSLVAQFADDLSVIRGAHQFGFGFNYIRAAMNVKAGTVAPGAAAFTANNTGSGIGDFVTGKMTTWTQGNLVTWYPRQNYVGVYAQDTWKMSAHLTINVGLRWEPSMPQHDKENRLTNIDYAGFANNSVHSTVFPKAPAGLLFGGDKGLEVARFAERNFKRVAPRIGLAWDPMGDGRTVVRASYGLYTDYPHMYQFNGLRDVPPWGSRTILQTPVGGFDNPWQDYPGGNPFPVAINASTTFPQAGTYVNVPRNLKLPYINQFTLAVQHQLGADWLVSANYLGNTGVHQLDTTEGNPGVYLGLNPCTINGTAFATCSTTANLAQRRLLTLQNPTQGQFYGNIIQVDDGGTRSYNAMLLSIQRRRTRGVTIQGNYTWSHCIDDGTAPLFQNNGVEVASRRRDNRGNCDLDRRHNLNMSTVYETPKVGSRAVQMLTGGWRISGIVRALSGSSLTITSGVDRALTGTQDQRPVQIREDISPSNRNAALWIDPAAFGTAALGSYGTIGNRNVRGPGSIRIDLGLVRTFKIMEKQSLEFRAEAFNFANHVNLADPTVILSSANFGKIQNAADPRIMQLALKFVF